VIEIPESDDLIFASEFVFDLLVFCMVTKLCVIVSWEFINQWTDTRVKPS
jgi:hypothetical protein